MYRTQRRRQENYLEVLRQWYEEYTIWFWIAGGALFVIVVAMTCNAFIGAQQRGQIRQQAEAITATVKEAQGRWSQAVKTVGIRRTDYPTKYSVEFDSQIERGRTRLGDGGQAEVWLAELAEAIAQKDYKVAEERIGQLGTIVSEDVAFVDRILGPPGTTGQGYYEVLDKQSAVVDAGLIADVQIHIDMVKAYVGQLPRKQLCGSGNLLSYTSVEGQIALARNKLDQAEFVTLVTLIEGFVDKPQVYKEAKEAEAMATAAKQAGDDLSALVERVKLEISQAETDLTNATIFVAAHGNLNHTQALVQLTLATSELDAAKAACASQDLSAAIAYADTASAAAMQAIWLATPPTATPEPTDTPRPPPTADTSSLFEDDDSDDSSSWWDDSGSDSGSWDDSSSDSGSWDDGSSDSGSWDYGDSDSDSWSDSWSDDSGSWDDSSSDSGSWDY